MFQSLDTVASHNVEISGRTIDRLTIFVAQRKRSFLLFLFFRARLGPVPIEAGDAGQTEDDKIEQGHGQREQIPDPRARPGQDAQAKHGGWQQQPPCCQTSVMESSGRDAQIGREKA